MGEVYDRDGKFINFPREVTQGKRRLDLSEREKPIPPRKFRKKRILCLAHERNNYSYFHWLFESFPKLAILRDYREAIGFDAIYIQYGWFGSPYQRQAMKHFGISRLEIIDSKRNEWIQAEEPIVMRLNEIPRQPTLRLCEAIRSEYIKSSRQAKNGKKLYLTRSNINKGRRIANEDSLKQILESRGFEVFSASGMTQKEQAELFGQASCIVGPHGAAFANIVFCSPGTNILELFHHDRREEWSESYENISKVCGFNLTRMPPRAIIENPNREAHRFDFVANLEAIEKCLKKWDL